MNKQTHRLLAVALVLFIVMIFALSKKRSSTPPISGKDAYSTENVVILRPQVIQDMPSTTNETSQAQFQSLIRKDTLEKEIGLQRMPLPREGDQAQLKVVLALKPSCSPGDADAISMDMAKDPSHMLLATFEDLAGNQKPLIWEVPQSLFKEGRAETVFKIPVFPEPSQYGFYLCTANRGDKNCSEKKFQDINEIFTEHLTKKPNAGQLLRNIFFQYFIVDDRGLASFSQISKGEKVYDKLKKYADEAKIQGKTNRAEIDLIKQTTKTIQSLPAIFSKDKLVLQLPKFRESACR